MPTPDFTGLANTLVETWEMGGRDGDPLNAVVESGLRNAYEAGQRAAQQVVHPTHYNRHASGVECWDLFDFLPGNLAAALKYLWRADHKGQRDLDRGKAVQHLRREAGRPYRAWIPMPAWQVAGKIAEREHPATVLGRLLCMVCDDMATSEAMLALADAIERGEA